MPLAIVQKKRDSVLKQMGGDNRIRVEAALLSEQVPAVLAGFGLMAVPSQWMETGTLVVLEAQALGVPVLGSRLGGIQGWAKHGVKGWLVPAGDVVAWSGAIAQLAEEGDQIQQLRPRASSVRTIYDATGEMVTLYRDLVPR